MTIEARATAKALLAVGKAVDRNARAALREAGDRAEDLAKSTTRFEDVSGKLRRNIGFVMSGTYEGELIAATPYALFVEAGTKPHEISAKTTTGTLRFMVGGRWVSKKSVQHPGTKATNFMRDAAAKSDAIVWVEAGVEAAILGS